MKRGVWLAAAAIATLWTTTASAQSSSCSPGTICGEYDTAAAVFVGRVAAVTPPADDRSVGPLQPQIVTFVVSEDFKGSVGSGTIMTFDPSASGARLFVVNETVLVYAKRTSDRSIWFAGCSRTRRIAANEPELATLRELQKETRGGSVEGWLQIASGTRPPALPVNTDLSNVRITLQPLDGAETIFLSTQPTGYFLSPWLRPGTYRMRIDSSFLAPIVRDVVIAEKARCQTLDGISVRQR